MKEGRRQVTALGRGIKADGGIGGGTVQVGGLEAYNAWCSYEMRCTG